MARAFNVPPSADYGAQPSTGDWQALRGELVALLDQVEGQYTQAGASNPALAGFAQRVRDLRYQVADDGTDDRRREALRSVKRQIERFNDRPEPETIPHADNVLQSAIQQIRARTQVTVEAPPYSAPVTPPPPPPAQAPAPAMPRFDELAHSMVGLSGRLEQLEAELRAQRGNATQVREIADQVSQLSHVVELLAGAVGETGQVKRLEAQIAGLAQLIGQAPRTDLTQLTERLDQVVATVDRLADLQVQQIRHVVEEAEAEPRKESETAQGVRAIEASVRNIYDRIDALESNLNIDPSQIERISQAIAQIAGRLDGENTKPDRLLTLVDALNGRINEIEDKGDALGGLRSEIESLRNAVLGAIEPRFTAIETQLGALGERLAEAGGTDIPGVAQLEAQVRQLVARMDQTGEQLSELARLYSSAEERPAPPDFEALANLVAMRSFEAMQSRQPAAAPAPDFEALADRAAVKASAAVQVPAPELSEANLAAIETRIGRLVEGLVKTRPPESFVGMQEGIEQVGERLARLELALTRRDPPPAETILATPPAAASSAPVEVAAVPPAATTATPAIAAPRALAPASSPGSADANQDTMPRNPAVDAPLKEFGFPDLGPVRAALEAKNGPRKRHPGIETADEEAMIGAASEPITPAMAASPARGSSNLPAGAPALGFDAASVERPPRPVSSLDAVAAPTFAAPAVTAAPPPAAEVSASTRNTFIEAARRSAQRHNPPPHDGNSLFAKAFARLQPGKPAEVPASPSVAAPAPGSTPMVEQPAEGSPGKSAGVTGLLPRRNKGPARVPEPVPELPPSVGAASAAAEPARESFLLRYRRPILLAASLVAVLFMALNLIMQRLSADGGPADVGSATLSAPAAEIASPTAPTASPDTATPAKADPAPKPVSDIAEPAAASADHTATASATSGPRIVPALTDPMATASINPGPAMSFAPTGNEAVMPPALAAANSAATDSAAPPVQLASAATDTTAAPAAAGSTDVAAPAALESPVKVELPPDGIGPLDLRQAAADGDAQAQFEIAAIYSEGRAVPQDFKQAAIWYERAAAQGFGPAQYRLGNLYENGKGVGKDLEQARLWYQRAAEAGNRMAMHNLAALYAGGQFGKQDFASAAEWFERAANLGMKDSQFNLGMLYARGLGVPQNLEISYKWFALAATGGDVEASKARDNVGRSLDAEAVKRASADAAAFKLQPVNLAANFAPIGTWEKNFDPGAVVGNKDVVTKVQVALMRLGFDVGTLDGHAGPKTAAAIKAFERGTGMSEVGQINPRLLAVLGSQPV
ncbi:MAG: peptidoglycan-binding protein [Devosia sp.]|nr:peptidoglycan-binding protein [Devosia sp.]